MLSLVQHQSEGTKFLRKVVEGSLVSPLLLLGQEGVGRKFSVLQAMREVFCYGDHTPTCQCSSCYQLKRGIHPDVSVISTTTTIGINEVRTLTRAAAEYPSTSTLRCFIIDGVDRFTGQAADAFLKTLEEPPALSRFFLLGEEKSLIIPTIISRCGVVRYKNLPDNFVASLVAKEESDPAKALVYARMGEGSIGRALRYCTAGKLELRDQVLRLLQTVVSKDLPAVFSLVSSLEADLELSLTLMEQLVNDILIVPHDPKRIINMDLESVLLLLREKNPVPYWVSLVTKIGELSHRPHSTHVKLDFHVKHILAEASI